MITKRLADEKIIKRTLSILFTAKKSTEQEKKEAYAALTSIDPRRIPYSAISIFVFDKDTNNMTKDPSRTKIEMNYFSRRYLEFLQKYIDEDCEQKESCLTKAKCEKCESSLIVGLKVYEHIKLAHNQVQSLFDDHDTKIKELELALDVAKETEIEMKKTVEELKEQSKETEIEMKETIKKIEQQSRTITSNYIAILGIFAAALMGAFGAITGFTSLFQHLNDVALGTILIVSGLGGMTVVSILFILLQSIAKLTDRTLGSFEKSAALYFRYPVITTSVLLLLTVSFIGAALNLSISPPKFSYAGAWWILPFIPLIFLVVFISKKQDLSTKSSRDN